ncbi:hypothetical protein EVAR_98446_1 [Eumeta japonica]|uniref:Uncharacterized protein n=1 Tax=Eumeta variegata TaxID=151549 RepID=A0A4C1YS02_EUMVA|nr:hypothetical protein EVAR_98446_1 [Eumeta japonica]
MVRAFDSHLAAFFRTVVNLAAAASTDSRISRPPSDSSPSRATRTDANDLGFAGVQPYNRRLAVNFLRHPIFLANCSESRQSSMFQETVFSLGGRPRRALNPPRSVTPPAPEPSGLRP